MGLSALSKKVWYFPDRILKPRYSYLGHSDRTVAILGRVRSIIAVALLLLIPIIFPEYARHLPHVLPSSPTDSGYTAGNVVALLVLGPILSGAAILAFLVLFALLLVAVTKPGSRGAAVRRLREPLVAFSFLLAWFGGSTLLIDLLGPPITTAVQHSDLFVRVVWFIVSHAGWIVVEVLTLKVIYYTAVYVCRAEDGHPALAPLVTTATVWTLAILNLVSGPFTGVPWPVAIGLTWGGAVSVTAINIVACWRLCLFEEGAILFRDGPPDESTSHAYPPAGTRPTRTAWPV